MADKVILQIDKLNKWYGVTHANADVDFQLKRGEIRGLIGENGSGKSTLTSQICGIQIPTSGRMFLNGKEYAPKSPIDANNCKVAMVVQELGVLGTLPVSVNMFMGHTKQFTKYGILNVRTMEKAASDILEKYGFENIPLKVLTQDLSIEQRKLVELVKALSIEPDILVLDEITQALSHDNRQKLYKIMSDFVKNGHSIIMISHDLEETLELCDSITVLRDGSAVMTVEKKEFNLDELKRVMIGREVSAHYYREDKKASNSGELVLSVKELTTDKLQSISFDLFRGEILGVCGLSDGGIHDLGRASYGKEHIRSGEILIYSKDGVKAVKRTKDITGNHGAYLSKDRDSEGLMLQAKISTNIQIPSLSKMASSCWFVSPRKLKKLADDAKKRFEIKCVSVDAPVNSMSGGNKQKVNLSRWLIQDLDFIILDCPTRGVDIGVKAYIYNLLEKEAKERKRAILLISDELPEVMGMSDRVLIMKDGKVSGMLSRDEGFAEEKIVEAMI